MATCADSPGGAAASNGVPPVALSSICASAPAVAEAGGTDSWRHWQTARTELEDIDQVIRDLRAETRTFEVRREVIARREATLRAEAKLQGHAEAIEADAHVGGEVIFSPAMSDGRKFMFEVMTPRPNASSMASPGQAGRNHVGGQEPVVYPMEDSPTARAGGPSAAMPTRHRLSLTAPSPPRGLSVDSDASAVAGVTPRHVEDWEHGLETFGVAKCGVCGMKLPLDVGALEQHSIECEAAKREGRRPTRSDLTSIPMQDEGSKTSDNSRAPAVGPTAAAASAGSGFAALAARASGAAAGGSGYPAAGAGGIINGSVPVLAAAIGPPKAVPMVGDRAALMRSRMQRSKSSQPSSRTSSRWRGAGF
mmetsp:Transcript_40006/g.128304  ORF Transcript_40006/g.128304 Transcript_40006/m.128304 type:complete len:365 (-) Transcript_40006:60-1154(-)